jgi:peptidoglycan/LPS O-acetylase OafA/YrhL
VKPVNPPPKGYLPTLDGWRAIAIIGVMVAHGTDALFAPGAPLAKHAWYVLTRYGARGVDLFFGISGFLICSRLLEEYEQRGRISLTGFYIRRFARILPPYVVYLLFIAVLGAAGSMALLRNEVIYSALFVRNYWAPPPDAGWYTAHLWSLAVEEHFYIIWPTLLVLLAPPRALWKAVALALAIAAWRFAVFHWPTVDPVSTAVSRFERTDLRLDALLWGCVMALACSRPAVRERLVRFLNTPVWILAGIAVVLVIVREPPLALLWQSLLIPILLAGTVLRPGSIASRVLEWSPVRWVGRISYSLYLWQSFFLVAWGVARPFGGVQYFPVNFVVVFLFATASYYFVERPMIRWGHERAPPTTEGRV